MLTRYTNQTYGLLLLTAIGFISIIVIYYNINVTEININQKMLLKEDITTKTILFWTTWFGRDTVEKELSVSFKECSVNNCQVIHDRNLIKEADAIVFHMFFRDMKETPIPTFRRPDQRYIFFTFESPNSLAIDRQIYKSIPSHFFNWTATYRQDSDLFGTSFYRWKFQPKQNLPHSERLAKNMENYFGINVNAKNKTAAWFVSNCQTKINRKAYVAELQKHFPVDVFGKCLPTNKSCPRAQQSECDAMLNRDYLFYLSFESSFCPDYVTEKFYRAFRTGTVPIVFGGANYSLFAPPHSYINAREFETPERLAEYLWSLTEDRDQYSRFFDWKEDFDLQPNSLQLKEQWCKLCQMLNDPNVPDKSYPNIEKWWFDDRPCENFRWPDAKT